MSILTIRLPAVKHARLRRLADSRGVSMNKLIDELATVALAQHDAEVRFRAVRGLNPIDRGRQLSTSTRRPLSRSGSLRHDTKDAV